MKIPVYGFEQYYEIDEDGNLYSKKTNKILKKAAQASLRQDRYRLYDKKYYDLKYLVYKSFNKNNNNIKINDDRIVFIDGNCRNNKINNLKLLEDNNRNDIGLLLSVKYGEKILPIPDFKNYYLSENGNLYSYYHSTSKVIKLIIGTDGYLQTKIPDNYGVTRHFKIHQWVAKIFVENPNRKEFNIVHHKDENKLNNNYNNLEWTTFQQNIVYSMGKQCCMLDKNYCILSIHDSIADLSRNYEIDSSTASKQCRGIKNQFTNGYRVRFFDEKRHNFVPTKFD